MKQNNQFALLTQQRFLPFFNVQFLGALNDNLFKTALLVLIAMTYAAEFPDKANVLTNIAAAAFIIPFFLFSATAGQLADKYEKRSLIRIFKFAEIVIAFLIGVGFYLENYLFLLGVLFLLGLQATFFSPVKYSILPQYLSSQELTGGNGLVEMGTFVAILVGTILGGLLMSSQDSGTKYITLSAIVIALIGWLFSWGMPSAIQNPQNKALKINWEPCSQTYKTLREATKEPSLFLAMIGISWFWFYGSILITQIPNYTQMILGGDALVMTLLLTVASLGIGFGSILCEPLGSGKEELGLVPLGALGLSLFAIDLSFAHGPLPLDQVSLNTFLQDWHHWHVLIDLFLIGLFAGFFSVPLYVLLQLRSPDNKRSQIIAANNIINAIFMTAASFAAIGLLQIGLNLPQLFLVVGLLNALVVLLIFRKDPEYLHRFKVWIKKY